MTSTCIFWQITVINTIKSPSEGDSLTYELETGVNAHFLLSWGSYIPKCKLP